MVDKLDTLPPAISPKDYRQREQIKDEGGTPVAKEAFDKAHAKTVEDERAKMIADQQNKARLEAAMGKTQEAVLAHRAHEEQKIRAKIREENVAKAAERAAAVAQRADQPKTPARPGLGQRILTSIKSALQGPAPRPDTG